MVTRARRALSTLGRPRFDMDAMDLSLRLTLLALLLQPIGNWVLRPAILGCAGAGLLLPSGHRSSLLWFALTALTAGRVVLDWPLADNHAYLLAYWCLAIALALGVSNAGAHLSSNARWLTGLVFLLAVGWKLSSLDYLDGTFFRVTLLVDDRFEGFTRLVGGLPAEVLDHNRLALEQHVDGPALAGAPHLTLTPRVDWLAALMTGWTLTIEAAVAIAFLWGPARFRHAALLVFCVTVYAVATVAGFGWLLVAMGVAQCAPDEAKARMSYVVAFVLILVYREVPWASMMADHFGAAVPG